MKQTRHPLTAALWSVAIPGFGQLYNRSPIKGVLLVVLEVVINHFSHLNTAIYYSWLFDIPNTQSSLDYQWLLFYPCFYVFAIYDAYHECCLQTGRRIPRYSAAPFFFTCYLGTVIVIWSSGPLVVPGITFLGPVFSGALLLLFGLGFGTWLVYHFSNNDESTPTPTPES